MRALTRIAAGLILGEILAGCALRSSSDGEPLSVTDDAGETHESVHPLKHPEFRMVSASPGTWNSHWMYPNQVMSYLLKSPRDAVLARHVLKEYGLGPRQQAYLFIARAGTPIVVNGRAFATREQVIAFIRAENIPKLLYVPENNAFPTQIPVWLDDAGIQVWVLKWQP